MSLEKMVRVNARVPAWIVEEVGAEVVALEECENAEEFDNAISYANESIRTHINYLNRVIDYISQLTYEDAKGGK